MFYSEFCMELSLAKWSASFILCMQSFKGELMINVHYKVQNVITEHVSVDFIQNMVMLAVPTVK